MANVNFTLVERRTTHADNGTVVATAAPSALDTLLVPDVTTHLKVTATGGIALNATTAIADGKAPGQLLLLQAVGGPLTIPDGANTDLGGALTLQDGEVAALIYDPDSSLWRGLTTSRGDAVRFAKASYSFAADGGAISAIGLTAELPDGAVIIGGGFLDVLTTLVSATDAATIAIHAQTANDLITAVAISAGGNVWDAGIQDLIPDPSDATSYIKCTAARELTATIAVEALTAGAFNLFVPYIVSEA